MESPIEVFVAVFKEPTSATQMVDTLKQMHKSGAINLVDAATVTHDLDGKAKIDELGELSGARGGARGAVVGGILGLIFPPSFLATAAVGAVAGGLWGKLRDTGMKTDDLKQIASELSPGDTAVIALVEDVWVQQFLNAASGYDRLYRQGLDAKAAAVISADPKTGEVVAAGFNTERDASAAEQAAAPADAANASAPAADPVSTSEGSPATNS